MLEAWARARRDGEELVVAGLEEGAPEQSPRRASASPACWSPTNSAPCCAAPALYVTAPRREDYGLAQLEALADGAMLVTTEAPGPTPRCRSPATSIPASSATTSPARCAPPSTTRRRLRRPRPHRLLPYRRGSVDALVQQELLPRLLT